MRKEVSAGGVVFGTKNKQVCVLLLKDPKGKWTFPKGLIEKDEDPLSCAKREIAEEVGLSKLTFHARLTPAQYKYRWDKELIDKTVHYFVFTASTNVPLLPQAAEGIQDVQWFPFDEALTAVGYKKTNTPLLKQAKSLR